MYFSFVVEENPVFACSSLLSNPVSVSRTAISAISAIWPPAPAVPFGLQTVFLCRSQINFDVKIEKYGLWNIYLDGQLSEFQGSRKKRESRRGSRVNRLERCENAVPAPEWSKQNVLRWQFSKNSNLFNCVVALVANLAMSFLETSYPQSGSLMLHFPPPPKSTEVSTQPLPTSLK